MEGARVGVGEKERESDGQGDGDPQQWWVTQNVIRREG